MTVSRVLKGTGAVKPSTRDKVLGYLRQSAHDGGDVATATFRRQKNILILNNGKMHESDDFLFNSRIYFAMLEELKKQGFAGTLGDARTSDDELHRELSRSSVAVLLPDCHQETVEQLTQLDPGLRIITVCFSSPGVSSIRPDDFTGGELAADYMIRYKYRRTAVFTGLSSECCQWRYQSFISQLKKKAPDTETELIEFQDIPFDDTPQYQALEDYCERHSGQLPPALFCPTGYAAMVAWKFVRRHNLTCEILGYDNYPFYDYIDTPLSRIIFNPDALGQTAAKAAMQMVNDPDYDCPVNTLIPVSLLDRHYLK